MALGNADSLYPWQQNAWSKWDPDEWKLQQRRSWDRQICRALGSNLLAAASLPTPSVLPTNSSSPHSWHFYLQFHVCQCSPSLVTSAHPCFPVHLLGEWAGHFLALKWLSACTSALQAACAGLTCVWTAWMAPCCRIYIFLDAHDVELIAEISKPCRCMMER